MDPLPVPSSLNMVSATVISSYQLTSTDTVESQLAYEQSLSAIRTPDQNTSNTCQATSVTREDRLRTSAILETRANSGDVTQPRNQDFVKHINTLFLLLDDDETTPTPTPGGGDNPSLPMPTIEIGSNQVLITATTTFTWTPVNGASDTVIEFATSAIALNRGADIARVCAGQSTQAQVTNLPLNGTQVHIRVWSKIDGQWHYRDHQLDTVERMTS